MSKHNATRIHPKGRDLEYLLLKLQSCSRVLEITSMVVYLATMAHIVIVFYTFVAYNRITTTSEHFYFPPHMLSGQIALIIALGIVIFVRDRLIVLGNDLFQIVSDRLEEDDSLSDATSQSKRARVFSPTKIRLTLRNFVSLTHLPLLRKSDSGEFVYLSFNVILGIVTNITRHVLLASSG